MDILDTTSHANAIITDLVKIAEKKGAAEGSIPKTIAAGINLITNTLSGNEEAKSPVIVRALDELVNAVDSGSGGGSSDFSTAELIFSKSGGVAGSLIVPWVYANGEYSSMGDVVESGTYNIILYKGNAFAIFKQNGTGPFNIAGTGDVEIDGTDMYITGDCTITIS